MRPSTRRGRRGCGVFDTNPRLKLWSLDWARALIQDAIAAQRHPLPSLDDLTAISGLSEPDALVDHCPLGAHSPWR